jgi:hypothetical protein
MTVAPRAPGPAYANLQRRKPREGIYVRRCGVTYGKLSVTRNFDFVAGGFSKNLGLKYVHNFGVMALSDMVGLRLNVR